MEVILLEKVNNVGGIGDRVKVTSQPRQPVHTVYGGAHLFKSDTAKKLEGQVLKIKAQSGSEGKLFGSVGTVDIAEAASKLGAPVERSEVRLHEGPLRVVGEHKVELHLHADVNVEITVIVESDEPQEAAH